MTNIHIKLHYIYPKLSFSWACKGHNMTKEVKNNYFELFWAILSLQVHKSHPRKFLMVIFGFYAKKWIGNPARITNFLELTLSVGSLMDIHTFFARKRPKMAKNARSGPQDRQKITFYRNSNLKFWFSITNCTPWVIFMDINLCSKELFAKNGKKGAKMLVQGPEQLKDGIFLQFWPQIWIPRH